MIYIINNQNNTITTDSFLDYIPTDLQLYLDDIEIGTFNNESTRKEYIILTIPSTSLVDLQNKEYNLKIYNNFALLKVELVIVKSGIQLEVKTFNKPAEPAKLIQFNKYGN